MHSRCVWQMLHFLHIIKIGIFLLKGLAGIFLLYLGTDVLIQRNWSYSWSGTKTKNSCDNFWGLSFAFEYKIFHWIKGNDYVNTSARCLQMMLRLDAYRLEFVNTEGLATIMSVLNGKANFQLQYQLIFCLWFSPYFL